jgi:hypothetical protein
LGSFGVKDLVGGHQGDLPPGEMKMMAALKGFHRRARQPQGARDLV